MNGILTLAVFRKEPFCFLFNLPICFHEKLKRACSEKLLYKMYNSSSHELTPSFLTRSKSIVIHSMNTRLILLRIRKLCIHVVTILISTLTSTDLSEFAWGARGVQASLNILFVSLVISQKSNMKLQKC